MGAYNLQVNDNLNGRTLALSIPDETAFTENKIIAATHNGNYIVEGLVDGESLAGITDNANWSQLSDLDTVFYNSGDSVNLDSVDLTDGFGTVIEIDESAVIYPYVKRTANEKVYGFSEDLAKVPLIDGILEEGEIEITGASGYYPFTWNYIKLKNGISVCWTDQRIIAQESNGSYGLVAPFPENFFKEQPIVFITPFENTNNWSQTIKQLTKNLLNATLWSPNASAKYNGEASILAFGRWK